MAWRAMFLGMLTFLIASAAQAQGRAKIENGVLDLRGWDFEKNELLALKGPWEFYWSQLIEPKDFLSDTPSGRELLKIPGGWYRNNDRPMQGYGTYRLHVILDKPREVSFYWVAIWSSTRVYVDGRFIKETGKVGIIDDPAVYRPDIDDGMLSFVPASSEFDIVVQAASYEFFATGILTTPFIGTAKAIKHHRELQIAIDVFLVGSLFMMAIYHFCLFALRTKVRSTLYFGLVCLSVGVYQTLSNARSGIILFPDILSFNNQLRVFNTWVLALGFFAFYINSLFPKQFSKRVAAFITFGSSLYYVYAWTVDARDFIGNIIPIHMLTAGSGIYAIYASIKAVRQKEEDAKLFLTGVIVLLLGCFYDILMTAGLFESINLGAGGLFIFVCCQSLLLARRFSNAFIQAEKSEYEIRILSDELRVERDQVLSMNENLERLVDEKTREIRSMMAHIQLGIFAISRPAFEIHKDHSQHLYELFEVSDLTQRNASEVLFQGSNLTSDELSQVNQALENSMGEDALAFELNSYCFPLVIKRKRSDGQERILDLTWHPILDEGDLVDKMLVTVRDVTEFRALEEEAQDKREELQFIGELINVKPEAFRRFLASCHDFINENRKLLHSSSIHQRDMEILKILFINMHTMKGAARSLYFKKMTRIFHDVEQYYAELQRDPHVKWDVEKMRNDLVDAEKIIASYASINKEKLGRKTGDEQEIEMPEHQLTQIYDFLTAMQKSNERSIDLRATSRLLDLKSTLFPFLFKPAGMIFENLCSNIAVLAKDLSKATPSIDIQAGSFFVTRRGEELLHKIFVHVLRNSMDHGMETAEERRRKGKKSEGRISIELYREGDELFIRYQDDGRGLNLAAIRKTAENQGLIAADANLSVQATAELIFRSGLSTASQVGDISGRGVGMDAIRKFLQREKGEIELQLEDDKSGKTQSEFYAFSFLMRFPMSLFLEEAKIDKRSA